MILLQELERVQELCNSLSPKGLQEYLILTIKRAQEKLDLLHDAHDKTSNNKRFIFEEQSITYTVIAEWILFIKACKSVLVELVIYGKEHHDFFDTVYDMCSEFETRVKKYELEHGR